MLFSCLSVSAWSWEESTFFLSSFSTYVSSIYCCVLSSSELFGIRPLLLLCLLLPLTLSLGLIKKALTNFLFSLSPPSFLPQQHSIYKEWVSLRDVIAAWLQSSNCNDLCLLCQGKEYWVDSLSYVLNLPSWPGRTGQCNFVFSVIPKGPHDKPPWIQNWWSWNRLSCGHQYLSSHWLSCVLCPRPLSKLNYLWLTDMPMVASTPTTSIVLAPVDSSSAAVK